MMNVYAEPHAPGRNAHTQIVCFTENIINGLGQQYVCSLRQTSMFDINLFNYVI